MPSELSQFKDLECYLRYPGDYPATKIQTEYQGISDLQVEPFLLKPEKKRVYTFNLDEVSQKKEELII